MKIKFFIIFIIFFPQICFANISYNIGTSLSFLNISDSQFEYSHQSDQFQLTNLTTGINYNYNQSPVIFTITTNRLLNRSSTREVIDNKNNKFINKNKTIIDGLIMSYVYKNTTTGLFISNTHIEKSIFYNGNLVGNKINNVIISGLNLNYFFDKNIYSSVSILAPKKEIGLNSGLILGLNYKF